MVGVPGKSRGCITCRRRKIRCDEKYPDCERCMHSGRTCEGYARYPTFLNRTSHGLQKRHALEEVKPRSSSASTRSLSDQSQSSKASESQLMHQPDRSGIISLDPTPNLQRQASNNASLNSTQLVGLFWSVWAPTNNVAQNHSDTEWMKVALSIPDSTTALQLSIRALALNRVGWANDDEGLKLHGSIVYGTALRELQRSLWDEKLMWHDESLAAAYILSNYEVSDPQDCTDDRVHRASAY